MRLNERKDKNAIKDNMLKVILDNSKAQKIKLQNYKNDQNVEKIQTHKNYGNVPSYLKKYNKQRENENVQKMIEEERAKIPAGTRLMPDEERLETLKDLEESRKEVNIALEKLPVVSRTI